MARRRIDKTGWVVLAAILAVAAGVACYRAMHPAPAPPPVATTMPTTTTLPAVGADNLLLGNPSGATSDPANRDNFLMVKPGYTLSYNDTKGTANWVSWRLTRSDLGEAPRKLQFDPDSGLPPGFRRVVHRDYAGSGFDRGHLCPHADRAATTESAWGTFVMTNVIPQAPNVNQKAWERLESYCRSLAGRGQRLYVVAGPAGLGGTGANGFVEVIGGGRVTVPAECWKVVVIVPEAGGSDDLAKVNAGTRVIAAIVPNDNARVGEGWAAFRTTVAEVERRTGYRFFDRLTPEVAAALKQKVDAEPVAWGPDDGGGGEALAEGGVP